MRSRVKMCSQISKGRKSLCFLKLGKLLSISSAGDARLSSTLPVPMEGRQSKLSKGQSLLSFPPEN